MLHFSLKRISIALAAAALAACSSNGNAALPYSAAPQSVARPDTGIPGCKGESSTTLYASTPAQTLSTQPADACIPSFGGYGGKLAYPATNPAITSTFTSSTTDYNNMIPTLRKGKPLFYLQFTISGATTFGSSVLPAGGIESTHLVAGRKYDIYGQVNFSGPAGIFADFTPCVADAVKIKAGAILRGFGSMLESQNMQGQGTITFEVFPHRSATTPCS